MEGFLSTYNGDPVLLLKVGKRTDLVVFSFGHRLCKIYTGITKERAEKLKPIPAIGFRILNKKIGFYFTD